MKILTPWNEIIDLAVEPQKSGGVRMYRRVSPRQDDRWLTGIVVLATRYELSLLETDPELRITVPRDFVPTDTYREWSVVEKGRFWVLHDCGVTLDPANGQHWIDGARAISLENALLRHNRAVAVALMPAPSTPGAGQIR